MKNKISAQRDHLTTASSVRTRLILVVGLLSFVAAILYLRPEGSQGSMSTRLGTNREQTLTPEFAPVREAATIAASLSQNDSNTPFNRLGKLSAATPSAARSEDILSTVLATNSSEAIDLRITSKSEPDKRRADQPEEAHRFRGMQLKDENGEIPLDGLQKAREQIDLMRARQGRLAKAAGKPEGLEVAAIGPGAWTWLGPGNIGGRIRSIVIDPTNPNKMFVGSVSGGIWRTTNAGAFFVPVDDFMANLAVSTMVMDPTNSNVIYAGTGESLLRVQPELGNFFDSLRGDGVFKSLDGGSTWNQLPQTRAADPTVCGGGGVGCPWSYVNRLAFAPDGSTLLAATINGVRRSTDGGATWSLGIGTINTRFADVDVDPSSSQQAVAGGYSLAAFSTDAGQNWIQARFTPNIAANGATGRIELAYAASNPLIVYASVDQNNVPSGQGAVYVSTDGGRNYNIIPTSNNLLGGQGGYDNIIWVNPQDPNFLIIGGVNLFRSTDGGANWSMIDGTSSAAHADHHMIVAHPDFNNTTNKMVYFGNDGGYYGALDVSTVTQTSGWTNLNNNLGVTQFYGAAANSAGVIVGGTQDNGSIRYSGDAQNWTTMSGGDGGYAAADPADNNFFYGEYVTLGLDRSTNGGLSASYIYCNPVPTNPNGGPCVSPAVGITDAFNGANFIAPFILDPTEPNRMLAGGLSLWRTNDVKNVNPAQNNGLPTWAAIKPPVSDGLIPPSLVPISAIAVSPNNPDFIVVGHNSGRIYLTLDGTGINPPTTAQCVPGNSPCWSRIDIPALPSRFVTRLVIDETRSPNWIYATFGGFSNNNVYVTKDLGTTWIDVSGSGTTGLPSVPVRSLVINPVRPNFIYVGTEVGVFASQDAGASWELPQGGPANVSVDELFFNAGRLFAVTYGRGVYKTALSVYETPLCDINPAFPCLCRPRWDCPCMWSANHVPNANEDVGIQCPMTIAADNVGAAQAKNLVVFRGATLTVNNTLGLAGDLINRGVIDGTSTFASIAARNVDNFRPENAVTTNGTISFAGSMNAYGNGLGTAEGDVTNTGDITLAGSLTAVGNVSNTGVVNIGSDLSCRNLTTLPSSILTVNNTLRLKGDITNEGSITGNLINLNSSPAGVHNFAGAGMWRFTNFPIASPFTVRLGSNVTFDIATLSNNGTLDLQNRTLNFRGINSFNNANGTVAGTGTFRFAPSDGSVGFGHQGTNFAPAVVVESGVVEFTSGGTINGPFTIDAGATFGMNAATLTLGNNATVDGSITNLGATSTLNFNGQLFTNNGSVGNINFLVFNSSGTTLTQGIAGTGSWSPQNIHVGQNAPSNTTLSLANNMSFASGGLNVFNGSTLNVASNTLTLTGPVNFLHPGAVAGSGLVRMQPVSGVPVIGNQFVSNGPFAPSLEIAAGTVNLWGMTIDGNLTVNSGASLAMSSFGPTVKGDVLINGNLNAFSGSPIFNFRGTSFTNNGAVTGSTLFFGTSDRLYTQSLAGTGTWAGTPNLFVHANSTTTLLSDVTYNGSSLSNDGRIDTGAFTLSLPCTVNWSGAGDIFGNVRRTNLAACPGAAIAYGNPFTTIQFTSGTPPTDITVNVAFNAPAGFPSAATRTYLITPTGGSGYVATLRLHYLDSELNGNNESSLQLWRNNGTNWTSQGVSTRNTTQNWVEYNNVTQFSPWALSQLAPTAANVAISGRVLTANGQGIRGARLTLTAPDGSRRTAITSTFGYYAIEGVEVGHTYVLEIVAKKFLFINPTRVFSLQDEITGMDFTAEPQ